MNKKKLLALLMALVMTLTLLPLTALAEEFDPSDLPEANVRPIEGKSNVPLIAIPTNGSINDVANLADFLSYIVGSVDADTMYRFTPKASAALNKVDKYGEWICDFRVTFDEAIDKNSMGLCGSYGEYNVAFLTPNRIEANESLYLLSSLNIDAHLTYAEVVNNVQIFDCGVFNVGEENVGKHMTVQLVMNNREDDNWYVISSTNYTFTAVTPVNANGEKYVYDDVLGKYNITKDSDVVFTPVESQGTFRKVTDTVAAVVPNDTADENVNTVVVQVDNTTDTKTEAVLTSASAQNVVNIIDSKENMSLEKTEDHNLKLYVKADKETEQVVDSITYQVDPYAIVDNNPAAPVLLTNADLNQQITFTFRLLVNDLAVVAGDQVWVAHRSEEFGTENGTYTVQADGDTRYVLVSTKHFSEWEITRIGNNVAAVVKDNGESVQYATLAEAFAAVTDNEHVTIEVLADSTGAGIVVPSGRSITVNFNNHSYTVTEGPGAGSTGTQNQVFQLLKDSTIVFNDGVIAVGSENADLNTYYRVIQNYANLTLNNMEVKGDNLKTFNGYDNSVIESDNGAVNITGSTKILDTTDGTNQIKAINVDAWNGTYAGTTVNINLDEDGRIGTVHCFSEGSGAAADSALNINTGSVGAVTVADESTVTVTKDNDATVGAPTGYLWVSNGDGTSSTLRQPATVTVKGTGLRKRVHTVTREVVDYETDLRFGFQVTLPEGASIVKEQSTFTWTCGGAAKPAVTVQNVSDDNLVNLIVTKIPNTAFEMMLTCKVKIAYQFAGSPEILFVESDTITRNVHQVASKLATEDNVGEYWANYGNLLLDAANLPVLQNVQ